MKQGTENTKRKPLAENEFVVTESIGLLDFLIKKLTKLSRNSVKSLLTRKEVFVDGRITSQHNHPLKEGQTVRIVRSVDIVQSHAAELQILFEDNDLIVINKPAGLLSIVADNKMDLTAYKLVTNYVCSCNRNGRIFVVHRLDRDTSGVLVFAKNERIKLALQENWNDLVSYRGYIAVVEGVLNEKSGSIRSWLKETRTLLVYSAAKKGDGLEAITNYKVIKETADRSLLEIKLLTGRKNQIRVHMKDLGHPVVGDKKYGAQTNPLKRLCLHAYKLELTHPFTNEVMCFETETPKCFRGLLKQAPEVIRGKK